jgi:hypothetical protein
LKSVSKSPQGSWGFPSQDAGYIAKNLSDPIIFPAVADRIGLLQHPQATVEFYMRILEAKAILKTISLKDQGRSINPLFEAPEYVTAENAEAVADCFITALQMARPIITDDDTARSDLDRMVRGIMLRNIEAALQSAKVAFPNAQSFRGPQP